MKKNQKLARNVMLITAALALIMVLVISTLGVCFVKKAYYESFQEELHAAALMMRNQVTGQWDGEWSQDGTGAVYKGTTPIHDSLETILDELHTDTGISFTFFYGDTRYVTSLTDANSGQRLEGTKAADSIVEIVLKNGEEHLATNFDIGGENFYAYYLPVKDTSGNIIGMMFAGRETKSVDQNILRILLTMVAVFLFFAVLNIGIGHWVVVRSNKAMDEILYGLHQLEDGKLSFYIDDKTFNRKDELGIIASSAAQLRNKLQEVIKATMHLSDEVTDSGHHLADSSDTASRVAGQVTSAVEEISKGAVSQAENVESSLTNTEEMGNSIEEITSNVDTLNRAATEMQQDAQRTVDAIHGLMDQNRAVMDSMSQIHGQINSTNDAVKNIAEASNIITSISEQTNLLSLNASIEAARAGEYGKGFAVVASEIGSLAVQSKEAAESIGQIVGQLVSESQKSVDTIEELNEAFQIQNNHLNETKNDMDGVVENVANVDQSAKVIFDKVSVLNKLKVSFHEIIEDLSAISQQNAASSEETNASMEELNATFTVIADSAQDLRQLAQALNERMKFFTLQEEA
ncbi:methyl-accepting chemotaxis protein [Lachnospiraceae bacterium KHCPX20]|nr:methyl-accepting chemotaxis protein [Lachnospiraceae bacterium KHCPX20]